MQSITQMQVAGLPEAIASAGGPGMQRGGRFAYTSSGTKIIATEWPAPSSMVLDGFEVICIGAGGGSGSYSFGLGGWRETEYVPLSSMGGASSVTVTVGAGSSGADGGASSFGSWVHAAGGEGAGSVKRLKLSALNVFYYSSSLYGLHEGVTAGADCPSGFRGGAGGNQTITSYLGGACYPHPNAKGTSRLSYNSIVTDSGNLMSTTFNGFASILYGAGNPVTTDGAAGHDGIGDWPGGGGNRNTSGSPGGVGGFPGGGAGGSSSSVSQRGGHGIVIVYPWFKKQV